VDGDPAHDSDGKRDAGFDADTHSDVHAVPHLDPGDHHTHPVAHDLGPDHRFLGCPSCPMARDRSLLQIKYGDHPSAARISPSV
jgi:hypothetical protein